jgi:hypothetical protein
MFLFAMFPFDMHEFDCAPCIASPHYQLALRDDTATQVYSPDLGVRLRDCRPQRCMTERGPAGAQRLEHDPEMQNIKHIMADYQEHGRTAPKRCDRAQIYPTTLAR